MIFEKLTSIQRLSDGFPFLLTACVLHGLGLAGGLATLRVRRIGAAAGAAGASPAVGAMPVAAESGMVRPHDDGGGAPWLAGESFLLLALPLIWWFGFILGPEDLASKALANSLCEPLVVAAMGVGYLFARRQFGRGRVTLFHFALLATAMAASGLLGWLMPMMSLGSGG